VFKKQLNYFICLITLSFCLYLPVSAQTSDYYTQTSLNTLYNQSGESLSTLKISLRNLTSKNYPVSLKVSIHGDPIDLLTARDDFGDVNYVYNYEPTDINTVEVKFNRSMVGKDILTHLNLTFKNPKANRSENTWVVFFPKISIDPPGDYRYQLNIPKSFGRLIAAETLPEIQHKSVDEDIYILKGQNLPISTRLIFGDSYPYKFTLTYPNSYQIILPKDSESQKIYITNISPEAKNIFQENGLWLADYSVAQEKIIVTGYVVFFKPDSSLDIADLPGFITPQISDLSPHPYQYLPTKTVNISLLPPKYFWPFIDNTISLQIKNPNFQALYNIALDFKAEGMQIISPLNPSITVLPPAGNISLPIRINFGYQSLFSPKSLHISTQDLQFSYNPSRSSLVFYYLVFSALLSFILIFTLYFAILSWRLFLRKQGRSSHLHW